MDQEKILQAIRAAISDINETLPPEGKIKDSTDAPLYGPQGALDSLTLTLFIVNVEQKIEQNLGRTITLVDQSMSSDDNNPFRNVAVLSAHIAALLASGEK